MTKREMLENRVLQLDHDRQILEQVKKDLNQMHLTAPGPILEVVNEMLDYTKERIEDTTSDLKASPVS
jgi:hypothetical protein